MTKAERILVIRLLERDLELAKKVADEQGDSGDSEYHEDNGDEDEDEMVFKTDEDEDDNLEYHDCLT